MSPHRRTEYASSTIANRYHVLGWTEGDGGELLDTFELKETAHVAAAGWIEDYDRVTLWDSMARRGAAQLWEVGTYGLEELERRPEL